MTTKEENMENAKETFTLQEALDDLDQRQQNTEYDEEFPAISVEPDESITVTIDDEREFERVKTKYGMVNLVPIIHQGDEDEEPTKKKLWASDYLRDSILRVIKIDNAYTMKISRVGEKNDTRYGVKAQWANS